MTAHYVNYETAAKKIIEHIGKNIFIGTPLGLGKPIGLLNAFYRLAATDRSINLTIITGLTLAHPSLNNELEKRFAEPIIARVLKDYEDPLYERARELQQLPDNIKIIEFFLSPGKYLNNNYVQQNYISSKYTSIVRDILKYPINVVAQQVAYSNTYPNQYSLSCNTDLFKELVQLLKKSKPSSEIAIVAEVNLNLPFMLDDAMINASAFTEIIDVGHYHALFALPREEVSIQNHLIGLYTSCLVKDDGCLQIGIGRMSNAIANALIFRHKHNDVYYDLLGQLSVDKKFAAEIKSTGSYEPFAKGLYASTEMLSDEFMHLYNEDILKKQVYDHVELQKLLNAHEISDTITPNYLDILLEHNVIHMQLTASDVQFLQAFGIFNPAIDYQTGNLILTSGETISANLAAPESKQKIIEKCLGEKLISGKVIHAGFFIGSNDFYQQLHNLSPTQLTHISMTSIARTNTLLWSSELLRLQRIRSRFINSAMMITLGGAFVSDGLKDLQEVSGVGGQFDFVNMAQNLDDARSIINCPAIRETKKNLQSNIIWEYANLTIARYLRDIFVTEYGIADCRSKTDAEVIKSILNITDSRFQPDLLKKAKVHGKLPSDYEIPKIFQNNHPKNYESLVRDIQRKGYCKPYPFGSELTDEEKILQRALLYLNGCGKIKLIALGCKSFLFFQSDIKFIKYLNRMGLADPKNIQDFFYKKLLKYIIATRILPKD